MSAKEKPTEDGSDYEWCNTLKVGDVVVAVSRKGRQMKGVIRELPTTRKDERFLVDVAYLNEADPYLSKVAKAAYDASRLRRLVTATAKKSPDASGKNSKKRSDRESPSADTPTETRYSRGCVATGGGTACKGKCANGVVYARHANNIR